MKKIVIVMLSSMLLVLSPVAFAAQTSTPASSPEKTWELKFHHHDPPTGKSGIMKVNYAKAIENATKGRVKITVFGGGALGKPNEAFALVTSGGADMAWGFTGFFPGQFPMTEIMTLPMIVGPSSAEASSRVLWALYEKFPAAFNKEYGEVKVLAIHSGGTSLIATSKKPIRTLEDLKGLNIRVPGGPPSDMLKALGANPIQMGTGDIYLSMEKGVIDGYSIGWSAIRDFKWYEVSKYFTEVYLYDTTFWVLMNRKTWDSFPHDVQEQIMSVNGEKGSSFLGASYDALHKDGRAAIKAMPGKEIITLSPQELERWKERAKPVWNDYIARLERKGLPGRDALNEALNLIDKYNK
jgi:TRAP-type C4-dicarboxylate transport system substrate-binding protein